MKNIIKFIPYGKENAISQKDLATILDCNQRAVRKMIHNARARGAVICSTCDETTGGYYLPLSAEEAIPYIKMQQSRLNSAAVALKPALKFVKQCKKGAGK